MKIQNILCPGCTEPMEPGVASARGTVWGFLVFGMSHQHLWFSSGDEERTVIESGDSRQAHQCPKCRIVTILPALPPMD
jgi:hypothetical protein